MADHEIEFYLPPALFSLALKYNSAPMDTRPFSPPPTGSSSSTLFNPLRLLAISSVTSLDEPSLPKLCKNFIPHISSSALQLYSAHHFPTSCCTLIMTLLMSVFRPR